ncbi:response regulator [Symbiobacterium thermophilum]|jgi:two-component system response regulator DevR|uniref:Stage 0 sporulation protein A homolog n=2 Tax=Symbiobacterium thermophilum TaxID=2734 RepID=Q67JS2_SYMTH|nr:response regulator transcription factor [Symbiobacterium thermophilum]BAD42078.1 two-component response regulator [Symbiobacterium thermophilum IAM 14863]
MPIRVLIVDDHELLREGLKSLLSREEDMEVVGEAAGGREAVALCRSLRPDVVVLDARLPDVDGVEVCRQLQEEMPEVAVLMLTTFSDSDLVLGAVRAGARGYVVKDVLGMDLKRSIRAVARGEVAMDPKVVGYLMQQMRSPSADKEERIPLNRQQLAIIRLVAQGYTNREIAERMFLSEKTVKGYLAEAMRRMGVKNRVEAAMVASKNGWI